MILLAFILGSIVGVCLLALALKWALFALFKVLVRW